MTDTFLDDHDTDRLAKHLREIATGLPELLRIARREVSPPGGKAANNPNGYSSRPPVNVGALDAANDVTLILFGWTRCLADDTNVEIPTELDGASLARHLRQHVDRIAQRQWAPDMAGEIHDQWRRVKRMTEPPVANYIGPCQAAGKPQCRGLFTGDNRIDHCAKCGADFDLAAVQAATNERMFHGVRSTNGTPMELAQQLREAGLKVTNKQITYWARKKLIAKRGEVAVGERTFPLYNLGEVEDAFYRMGGKRPARAIE